MIKNHFNVGDLIIMHESEKALDAEGVVPFLERPAIIVTKEDSYIIKTLDGKEPSGDGHFWNGQFFSPYEELIPISEEEWADALCV